MVSWCPAPPMAQVRSVLSCRQLVEIPRRLSIHLLRYLHPVPGTHPLQQAAGGGIGFTNSVLLPGALSLFGMLLRRGTDWILFFGVQDKFDFNRTCVHGVLSGSLGGLNWFIVVIWRGYSWNYCQLKIWGPRRIEKLFTEGGRKCAGRSRMKLLKNTVYLCPVGKLTFPNTEVILGTEWWLKFMPLKIFFILSTNNTHCHNSASQ